ncbi:MAG: hypothetical protein HQ503_13070 [Rhodospirillales bacterium]|nr:hypothetical protein [Rhodospirillales bacterium]
MAEIDAARAPSGDALLARMPGSVIDTLTVEQKEAIYKAAESNAWDQHPVNVRFTLPFIRRRFFLTIVGGLEQRSAERRAHERHQHPVKTIANIFFFIGIAAVFYMIGIIAIALQTSLIEF